MYGAWSVAAIRAAEADAFAVVGDEALMQRAATGLAAVVLRELREIRGRVYGARVLVVAGSGNNGGDGLFAAAQLARRGVAVLAWRTAGVAHAAGWAALIAAGGREVDADGALASLSRVDLVIDAVVGIGGRGGLADPVALLAGSCRSARVPVIAVDLPSGLPPEPGGEAVPEARRFTADVTVTFGGRKPCHVMEPARSACGRIVPVDIGLALDEPLLRCWEPADVAAVWPVPTAGADKYSRGVVGIDAGSARYPGAGVLTVVGAVHAGAGMVRYLGADAVATLIRQRLPNVVYGEGQVQARVLGSGWGDRPEGRRLVADAVESGLPVVIDADALGCLPAGGVHPGVLLTPHAGELARVLGVSRAEVTADPLAALAAAVSLTRATVLLKGATQYVADPGSVTVEVAVPGPAWTAQAGSGDVLAGICGTLLAAGLSTVDAAMAGASIQALAARAAPGPVPPQDMRLPLPLMSGHPDDGWAPRGGRP